MGGEPGRGCTAVLVPRTIRTGHSWFCNIFSPYLLKAHHINFSEITQTFTVRSSNSWYVITQKEYRFILIINASRIHISDLYYRPLLWCLLLQHIWGYLFNLYSLIGVMMSLPRCTGYILRNQHQTLTKQAQKPCLKAATPQTRWAWMLLIAICAHWVTTIRALILQNSDNWSIIIIYHKSYFMHSLYILNCKILACAHLHM